MIKRARIIIIAGLLTIGLTGAAGAMSSAGSVTAATRAAAAANNPNYFYHA